MGVMRFLVHPARVLTDWPEVHRAYISGLDGRVYPTRVELDGQIMTCRRPHSESGKLNVAWPVSGFGRPVMTTASLPERDAPYLLAVELARGKLADLREQCATWELLRMQTPPAYHWLEKESFRLFTQATGAQSDPERAGQRAAEAIAAACQASQVLVGAYTEQRLAMQRMAMGHPAGLLGCTLDGAVADSPTAAEFWSTFTAAVVPIEWRSIEPDEGTYHWDLIDQLMDGCSDRRVIVRAGPLIDLGPGGLPEWLAPWHNDFLNLQSFVCDFIETAVSRYTGRIRIWEVSAHGNTGMALGMAEENRLALVARTLEAASRTDSDSQFFIRIDQPWSEYQARGQHRLSAFQFVDALVRSNIGLRGVNLEVAIGYRPRGSLLRDTLGFSRLIDYWSQLGIQVHVTLAFPSRDDHDPQANPDLEVDRPVWDRPWSEAVQAEQLEPLVRLLMAKPAVTGVFWTHFHDAQPHQFPHAGLVRPDGTVKPALKALRPNASGPPR
jgi:hypothetical protein